MKIKINEIFYSIQGESTFSGLPCVFIRLTGCNLRCSYCDTEYSYNEGTFYQENQIIDEISKFECKLVLLTGGEPLYQDHTKNLIKTLADLDYKVLLETNGTYDLANLDDRCIKIMDIKCPDSNVSDSTYISNIRYFKGDDQIKFVLSSRTDYEFAKDIILKKLNDIPYQNIIISSVKEKLTLSDLAKWILEDNLKVRLQIQIHKFIWPDVERGV
ncbi:MAG: radical SAM protein [Deltaproteobacteria bacterium]|nr:radical SAM protein [Deltaproteobacteria bacterium]